MAAGKQLHGNFTPAHDAGCAAQCFEGVQRGNLIILPVNPRPQAATRTGENLRDTEQRIANLFIGVHNSGINIESTSIPM